MWLRKFFRLHPFGIWQRDTSRTPPCGDLLLVCRWDIRDFLKLAQLMDCQNRLNIKINPRAKGIKARIIVLLTLFLLGKSFALLHDFSHNYLEKNKSNHCSICVISHANSHGVTPDLVKIATFAFVVAAYFAAKSVSEKSSKPSSNLSRAPPQFS